MEENKQIIYHKSDWGSQVIKIILVLCFLFFSYKKNPTKELFTQELIKEYAIKNGIDNSIYWYADASNGVKWEGDDGYFCVSHPDAFHYYTNEKCNEQAGFHKLDLTGEYTSQGLGE
jgi:hypothetical protein